MFVSEYFELGDEFDKKEIFDCILDKDSPFFINLMRLKVCDIPEFQGSYQSINDRFSKIATLLNAFDIVKKGVQYPEIFHLVSLFEENIGSDRLSEIHIKAVKFYYYLRIFCTSFQLQSVGMI